MAADGEVSGWTILGATLATGLAMGMLLDVVRRVARGISISYRISVLGLPRAGKTALIAAMFGELFSDPRHDLSPVGTETIGRINQFIEMLDGGRAIPPTRERDVFIFRFLYYVRRIFIARIRYEGEVVDFPGEMSRKLLDSASDGSLRDDVGLFGREFYQWILSSRAVIFVVDAASYCRSDDKRSFIARMTAEIRAAWQLLQEENASSFQPGSKKVALVFSKIDVVRALAEQAETAEQNVLEEMVYGRPFSESESSDISAYVADMEKLKRTLESEFSDLIEYFTGRERQFQVFSVSSYFRADGRRYGVRELLSFTLPERAALS